MDSRVRYGVLSTAQIARNRHVPTARESRRSEMIAISSRDTRRARAVADELGMERAYGQYEELISDDGIDAVINPLPNPLHCEWTVKAAEAGKHVFCEKPLAMDVAECRRMIDACTTNGVIICEAFTQYFTPMMERIQEIVASGGLGDVNTIYAAASYTITDWEHDVRVLRELGGGCRWCRRTGCGTSRCSPR